MEYLNRILCKFMIGVNIVLIIAYIIFAKIEVIIVDYLHLLIGASVISIIAYVFAYIKMIDTVALRYVVLTFNAVIYYGIIMWTGVDIGYIAGMAVSLIYILYMDIKLMKYLLLVIGIPNMVSIFTNVYIGKMHDGSPLNITSLAMQFFAIMWYCNLLIFVISLVKKKNDEKIRTINEANNRTQKLMDSLLDVAEVVRENAENSACLINDLDYATENTNIIFDKIAEGNDSNVISVEKQTEMTIKITELLEKVVDETTRARITSRDSIKELNASKEFLKELQGNSKEIIVVNRKIFDAIEKFVESTKSVKYIIGAIEELSDEINLLSINARIESAKAGAAGKGFAVVATAVNGLAEQTTLLAKDIEGIIDVLETDAKNAQSYISEVEKTVENENITLENTITEFGFMETKIQGFDDDMKNILTSTDDVVSYNEQIRTHIEELYAKTEEVTAYIEEVLFYNKNNKEKMNSTTQMINELNVAVQNLKG